MWPGNYDRDTLAPLYTSIFKAYSTLDSTSIMAFEPAAGPPDAIFDVGFKSPPGGTVGSTHHIMNEHAYCCGALSSVCNEPATNPFEPAIWGGLCGLFFDLKF